MRRTKHIASWKNFWWGSLCNKINILACIWKSNGELIHVSKKEVLFMMSSMQLRTCKSNNIHSWMLWACSHGYNEWIATWSSVFGANRLWSDYRTEYNIIAENYSTVRYFKAPYIWSDALVQPIWLFKMCMLLCTHNFFYQTSTAHMLQWTNENMIIIAYHDEFISCFMGITNWYVLNALLNFKSWTYMSYLSQT